MISTLTLHFIILQEHYNYIFQKQYITIMYFINKIFNEIPLRITVTTLPNQYIYTLLTQFMISLTIKPTAVSTCQNKRATEARMTEIMP